MVLSRGRDPTLSSGMHPRARKGPQWDTVRCSETGWSTGQDPGPGVVAGREAAWVTAAPPWASLADPCGTP